MRVSYCGMLATSIYQQHRSLQAFHVLYRFVSSVERVARDVVSVTLFVMIPSEYVEFVSRLERVAINNVGIPMFEFRAEPPQ